MGKTLLESESDALTGIANRRGFERQSARVFADARRTGKPLTIVTFDLDRFKAINDTYGHSAGDAVIRAFADVLRSEAPESAVIARLGGEEFVMLLDRTSQRGAWPIAQAVREATMAMDRRLPPVTVSGGIAERQPGDSLDTVLHRADRWAYAAKNSGRNRICPDPAGASLRVIARNN
nr:GGDEF domain-containing protein [Polymorphobacter fuscus]